MTPRQRRAFEIRDAGLRIVERHGEVKRSVNINPYTYISVRTDEYSMAYNNPEHPMPGTSDQHRAIGAAHGIEVREPLPYSLDIWIEGINKPGRMGKVLSISWDEGHFILTAFKRGPWEERIISAASDA